jgi:hypothetical protein
LVLLRQVSQRVHSFNFASRGQQKLLQVSVLLATDVLASSTQVFPLFISSVQPLVFVLDPDPSGPIVFWQVLEQADHGRQACHSASLETIAVTLFEMPLIPNLQA